MAHICPETNEKVLYLDCLDCDAKSCRARCCASTPQGTIDRQAVDGTISGAEDREDSRC